LVWYTHGTVLPTITTFDLYRKSKETLSRVNFSCYMLQDHQTWCGSTSWDGAVSHTITRSLSSTFWEIKGKLCPKHIFYAISCRITKLGVVVHHGMAQCCTPLLDHSDLLFWKPKENLVQTISFVQVVLT